MSLASAYQQVLAGERVSFRPRGSSMVPLVPDRALVEVAPCHPEMLEPGDVVLVRVAGVIYLHKVLALDLPRRRVQIGSIRGRVNGWAAYEKVAGIAVSVDGQPRPRVAGKLRSSSGTTHADA